MCKGNRCYRRTRRNPLLLESVVLQTFGNLAISSARPMALRPGFTTGLPLSVSEASID